MNPSQLVDIVFKVFNARDTEKMRQTTFLWLLKERTWREEGEMDQTTWKERTLREEPTHTFQGRGTLEMWLPKIKVRDREREKEKQAGRSWNTTVRQMVNEEAQSSPWSFRAIHNFPKECWVQLTVWILMELYLDMGTSYSILNIKIQSSKTKQCLLEE